MNIYSSFADNNSKKLAVLIDPDKYSRETLTSLVEISRESGVSYFFVGGSLLTHNHSNDIIRIIKEQCSIPVIIFPGDVLQVNEKADGILLLSLISGRNADLLIGRHVVAAPFLKKSGLEILPTGYMLIESGKITTALYISNTIPKKFAVHAGAMTRIGEGYSPKIAFEYNEWYFGLSYDIVTKDDLSDYSNYRGGPEMHLRYIITKAKPFGAFKICPIY